MDTMTKADPREATRRLLALAQEQWERRRDENDRERRQVILAALAGGMSAQSVADCMGLSRQRVQQLRDDTQE